MYLDGSALTERHDPNKPGGWGVYMTSKLYGDKAYRGGAKDTTVSRMEMTAMNYALGLTIEYVESCSLEMYNPLQVQIYSDSQMVVRSINLGWLRNWVREKFVHRINSDIWKDIWGKLEYLKRLKADYEIIHMSGHQKNLDHPHILGNSVADMLADYKQYL